jgi:hypothetical protein
MQILKGELIMDIYRICTSVKCKTRILSIKKVETFWEKLMYSKSEDEAIKEYKRKYRWLDAGEWWIPLFAKDIKKEVVCIDKNNCSLNEVKHELTSDEFLAYCKERFGLTEFMNKIV